MCIICVKYLLLLSCSTSFDSVCKQKSSFYSKIMLLSVKNVHLVLNDLLHKTVTVFCICAFLTRYGAANMAAVKPMIQQPGGAKPNSSYNNNNGRTAAPSMQQEQSITQVQ